MVQRGSQADQQGGRQREASLPLSAERAMQTTMEKSAPLRCHSTLTVQHTAEAGSIVQRITRLRMLTCSRSATAQHCHRSCNRGALGCCADAGRPIHSAAQFPAHLHVSPHDFGVVEPLWCHPAEVIPVHEVGPPHLVTPPANRASLAVRPAAAQQAATHMQCTALFVHWFNSALRYMIVLVCLGCLSC